MKPRYFIVGFCILLFSGCSLSPTPTTVPEAVERSFTDTPVIIPPDNITEVPTDVPIGIPTETPTSELTKTATPTSLPQGKDIIVTSKEDSGPGSLRQALEDAQSYDTILFDPGIFPPESPESIVITSEPLRLGQGHITIDASNAGVILDAGSYPRDTWDACLEVGSSGNIIKGLQVIRCTGAGIVVTGNNNTIGGDRKIGEGPIGQGNLSTSNGVGIGIWSSNAENNVVTGNLVGTDLSGDTGTGNWGPGVWIVEGGKNNIIGPDNIIANNYRCGIDISDPRSYQNTLSNNSIHDNQVAGICIGGGANEKVGPPFITEFNHNQGLLAGTTCPNCRVEVYSDMDDQGAVLEGQTEADEGGLFVFEKGSAFALDNITAITTDADGNSSRFSYVVGLIGGIKTLQDGNTQPKFQLMAKTSKELPDDYRLGWGFGGGGIWGDLKGDQWQWWLDVINDFGYKRIDTSIQQGEEPIFWEREEFDVFPEYDLFVDGLNRFGIAVNYMIHFWDKEGHNNGLELETPRFKNEEQIQDFLEYVRFLVGHFKGRIQYYTIWSEPDNCGGSQIKCIEPQDYIELARRTIPVIHEEDPQAKVVIGPSVFPQAIEYLLTILKSDVVPLFDVVSWHGIYDVTPYSQVLGNYYYEYPLIIEEIKQTATENGFQGEFWGTDIGYCSMEYQPCGVDHAQEKQETDKGVAKYISRLFVIQMGLDVGVGWESIQNISQPWSSPTIQNLNTLLADTAPTQLMVEIENGPPRTTTYAFILPDGDLLLAIWSDDRIKGDDHPGVPTKLTFSGISAEYVEGIDVLHGYRQELINEVEQGNLVINNLMVMDYPILIRFNGVSNP